MRSNTTTLWDLPLSRRLDPVTSFEAAEELQASGKWQRQKSLVLDALRQHPGMTSAELAKAMGVDRYVTSRRLPDLRRDGLVENGETRICEVLGRRTLTWQAIERTRHASTLPGG